MLKIKKKEILALTVIELTLKGAKNFDIPVYSSKILSLNLKIKVKFINFYNIYLNFLILIKLIKIQ